MSKQTLAVELSKLAVFDDANQKLEQYSTDSETAADLLWAAHMQDWIKDKEIIDLGAGTGILGIGCLMLGAKKVVFVEIDKECLPLLKENIDHFKNEFESDAEIIIENEDIKEIYPEKMGSFDLVVQNPPFGTQEKNVDALFLEKAFLFSDKVITMHKTVTKSFIKSLSESHGFREFRVLDFNYPLKRILPQHKKEIEYIKVTGWFLVKS
ncbi:MAG: METTL5 family protein [Candidatus Nanoarchaeia archaeon]